VESLGSKITGSSYVVHLVTRCPRSAAADVDWHKLYASNKKVVGANPNVIYPVSA